MTSPLPHKRTTRRHASPSTFIRGSGCFLFTAADTLPVVFDSWHYVNRFLCYAISVGHLFSIPYARMPSKMAPYSYLDLWGASTAVSLRCTAHQGSSIASCAWSKHHAYRHTCLCSYPRRADGRRREKGEMKGGSAGIKVRWEWGDERERQKREKQLKIADFFFSVCVPYSCELPHTLELKPQLATRNPLWFLFFFC